MKTTYSVAGIPRYFGGKYGKVDCGHKHRTVEAAVECQLIHWCRQYSREGSRGINWLRRVYAQEGNQWRGLTSGEHDRYTNAHLSEDSHRRRWHALERHDGPGAGTGGSFFPPVLPGGE